MIPALRERARRAAISLRNAVLAPTVIQQSLLKSRVPLKWKRRLPPIGTFELHTPDGAPFRYVATPQDVMARGIIWDDLAEWERASIELLTRTFPHARVFWDIGAYAGIYSLLACATNPSIEVVAVEPVPQHFGWLCQNVDANGWTGRIRVVRAAVSPSSEPVSLTIVDSDPTASGIGVDRDGSQITVPSLPLERLGRSVDLIKIDVEGSEVAALESGRTVIATCRPDILAECLDRDALERFLGFIRPLGYEVHHVGPGGLERVDAPFNVPGRHANFFAHHPQRGPRG